MEKTDIVVIGAGVAGLAVAARLIESQKEIFIVEKNLSFGRETSSRNSEVIHGGMYYPKDSLKCKTCIEGRRLLYEFCAQNSVPHKKIGKLIVAVDQKEVLDLEDLFKHGIENGVEDLKLLSKEEIKRLEPNITAQAAIFSPVTGIIDSHSFMKTLAFHFESKGGTIAYDCEVTGIEKIKDGFEIMVSNSQKEDFKFAAKVIINASGLNADTVAGMAGLKRPEYRLKFCKGDYFRSHQSKARYIAHLIYPVPTKNHAGLGIHATLDLGGGLRFGPDTEYIKDIHYEINSAKAKDFYQSIRRFLPFMELSDLTPDISGVRPKLQGPNEPVRDFIINDETENGLPGFINLVGIESPGLTASLSIAKIVGRMVEKDI